VVEVEPIWLVAILACPVLMGVMMFVMMRGLPRRGRRERTDEDQP
jgi:hypothetical protein